MKTEKHSKRQFIKDLKNGEQMREIKETAQTEDDYFYHKELGNVCLK